MLYAVIRLKYFKWFKEAEFYFERIDFALANQLRFFCGPAMIRYE